MVESWYIVWSINYKSSRS